MQTMSEERAKKEYNRCRNKQIIIRFSEKELAELNEAITESGLSKTDFFLQVLRKSNIIILSDLKEICVELKRQGINLNQALRYYHESLNAEEIKRAIYNCNEVYENAKNIFLSADNKLQKAQKRKVSGQQKKENKPREEKEKSLDEEVQISESIEIAKRIEKMYQAKKETKAGEK